MDIVEAYSKPELSKDSLFETKFFNYAKTLSNRKYKKLSLDRHTDHSGPASTQVKLPWHLPTGTD